MVYWPRYKITHRNRHRATTLVSAEHCCLSLYEHATRISTCFVCEISCFFIIAINNEAVVVGEIYNILKGACKFYIFFVSIWDCYIGLYSCVGCLHKLDNFCYCVWTHLHFSCTLSLSFVFTYLIYRRYGRIIHSLSILSPVFRVGVPITVQVLWI